MFDSCAPPSPPLPLRMLSPRPARILSSSAAAAWFWHHRHVHSLRAAQRDAQKRTTSPLRRTTCVFFPPAVRRRLRVILRLRRGIPEGLGGASTQGKRRPSSRRWGMLVRVCFTGQDGDAKICVLLKLACASKRVHSVHYCKMLHRTGDVL